MGRSPATIACPLRDFNLCDGGSLKVPNVPTRIIHSKGAIQLESRPVMLLRQHRPIQLSLRKPEQFRAQIYMMTIKATDQDVCTSGAELRVAVHDRRVELIISGW